MEFEFLSDSFGKIPVILIDLTKFSQFKETAVFHRENAERQLDKFFKYKLDAGGDVRREREVEEMELKGFRRWRWTHKKKATGN